MVLLVMGSVISMASADYSYDIGEPNEEFNKAMTNATVDVSFDVERDAWAIKIKFNATHNNGTAFTEKDLFEWDGKLYLDSNNEVNSIYLASNGSGLYWGELIIEDGMIYAPFKNVKPDEDGQCDVYLSHDYIHLWEGHLIHRRTSNIASINYDKVLKIREEAQGNSSVNPSDKPSSISGIVFDQESKVLIEGAVVAIGGDTSVTNDKGEFYLYNVKAGNVTISVKKDKYYELKDHIEVFPDTNYQGVEILLEANTELATSTTKNTDSEGYTEDKEKANSGVGGIAVIGGVIAGAGLLFFRNGLKKKKKKNRERNNRTYNKSKKLEKQVKKIDPNYENKEIKKIEAEEKQLEKERLDKIESMKRVDTESVGTTIGKGIRSLLDTTKQITGKVKKLTDKIQGEIDKIRNINLASYKGTKLKVNHLIKLFGDPFKKFTKIRKAIDAFHKKNLNKWARGEVKELLNVAIKLTDKVNLLKRYRNYIENSKDIKRAINIHKEINVAREIIKRPDILLEDNVSSKLKSIKNSKAHVGSYLNEGANKIGKLDKAIKETIIDNTSSFTKDVNNELK